MLNEKERSRSIIDAILRRYHITKIKLSTTLGYVSGSNLGEVYAMRANFNKSAKKVLKDTYKVNIEWLEEGNGEMFTDQDEHEPTIKENKTKDRIVPVVIDGNEREYITYVPLPAQAGFAREYPSENYIQRLPHFSIPGYHNGNALAFPVEGVSMTPTLYPGDIVICEPVERLEWIEPKDIHVIVSARGRQTKRLIFHKDKDNPENSYLECISDNSFYNKDELKEQRKIPVEEVRHVFKVVMVISGNLPVPDETLKLIREILTKIDIMARRDINLS